MHSAYFDGDSGLIFEQIRSLGSDNFTYLIGDEITGEAMIVDPPSPIASVCSLITKHRLRVKYIVNTHGHRDHTSGNAELASATGGKIAAHSKSRNRKDVDLEDSDILALGNLKVKVLHTPGHSPDSVCLLVDRKLLTGDTLFVGECGRTDLSGGDSVELYESVFGKILKLEDDIEIYPGHDYGTRPSSILGLEKKTNYTLEPRTLEEFIEFMSEP
jgi:glyoxylase-like metal-dependent hydrolase (beta-lactamase superfamily II)